MMKFSQQQIDVLKELINIGVGKGASVLNTMLHAHIELRVPLVELMNREQMIAYLNSFEGDQLAVVNLPFDGQISGSTKLIFPTESAVKLVDAFTGEDLNDLDFDSIRVGTLTEIGNIVINSVMGAISNMLNMHLNYIVPNYFEGKIESLLDDNAPRIETPILLAQTRFAIQKLEVIGDIAVFLEVGSFESLLEAVDSFLGQ